MFCKPSKHSDLTLADSAAIFGAGLACRNPGRADLVQYGTGSAPVKVRRGDSLLKVVDRFGNMGGTRTAEALRAHYRGHDRVVIVTDEQAWHGSGDPGATLPTGVPLYTWNLAGYRHGHEPGGPDRHTFAGLTDQAFRMIPLLEAGRDADWPF